LTARFSFAFAMGHAQGCVVFPVRFADMQRAHASPARRGARPQVWRGAPLPVGGAAASGVE